MPAPSGRCARYRASQEPAGELPVPGWFASSWPLTKGRLAYGIPLAGVACWDPVNAVTAPVGVVSVT